MNVLRGSAVAAMILTGAGCSDFSEAKPGATGDAGSFDSSVSTDAATPPPPASSFAVALAGIPDPHELLSDGTVMWIAGADGVHRWPIGAPAATRLAATGQPARSLARASDGRLFYMHGETVDALPSSDAPSTPVVCRDSTQAFALLDGELVWSTSVQTLTSSERAACGNENLLTNQPASLLVAGGGVLYRYEPAIDTGRLSACTGPPTCGSPLLISAGVGKDVKIIVADLDRVYWATSTGVFMAARTGGPARTLATDQSLPRSLVVAADRLYWTNYRDGTVMRVSLDGSDRVERIATGLSQPWGLVITPSEIFVAESGAKRIIKFPLP